MRQKSAVRSVGTNLNTAASENGPGGGIVIDSNIQVNSSHMVS